MTPQLHLMVAKNDNKFGVVDRGSSPNSWKLGIGEALEHFCDRLIVDFDNAHFRRITKFDLLPVLESFPVVSEKFRDLIEEHCNGRLQTFPCELRVDGLIRTEAKYFALNILMTHAVIDLQRSSFLAFPSQLNPGKKVITSFKNVVLRDDLADIPDIFREENYRGFLLCTSEFVNACKMINISVDFLEFHWP